ncbi:hypothetical protein SPONL_1264 [uncultured Candidatus Thioglobus sp.]|nr:hypothetical protein SPONL_1264 [uncultured Candidatus Thioglobus sp.]
MAFKAGIVAALFDSGFLNVLLDSLKTKVLGLSELLTLSKTINPATAIIVIAINRFRFTKGLLIVPINFNPPRLLNDFFDSLMSNKIDNFT